MRRRARVVRNEHGAAVGDTLLAAILLAENQDNSWTTQVNKLRRELDALEARHAGPYRHFFFTCPKPGEARSDDVMVYLNCVLRRDFGKFRKGETVPQIVIDLFDDSILLYDGASTELFKVEVILQG